MIGDLIGHPGLAWLIAAALFAIAEIVAPGVFLVFVAAGAAATGIATVLIPWLPTSFQVLVFAIASGAAVAVGRRWYRRNPVPSSDPLLNDRIARLVGEVVTVVDPIESGHGRVRVGDGEWLASGPDAPRGARVRITGGHGAILHVEPQPPVA